MSHEPAPSPAQAQTGSVRTLDRRSENLVIALMIIGAFAVILNETTLGVAIPHLMTDLNISATLAQWMTTGFMLTMAVVIPITGFLLNRLSTRQMFAAAMIVFIAGTVLGAAAPGFGVLLVARVIQASGTAVMMPLTMTTILNLVPIQRRGQTMGLVGVCISLAPALGPTLSGVILQYLSWRWIFIIMVPVATVPLVLGLRLLVNVTERRDTPMDILSVFLSAVGFGGLVYGLTQLGGEGDATSSRVRAIVILVVAVVALALFAWRQIALQKPGNPLLDLRVLTHRDFAMGLGINMTTFMSLMGVALIWPIYLQDVRHVNSVTTGLLLLPGGLAMGLLGPFIGRLFDRVGARVIVVPAVTCLVVMIFLMSRVGADTALALLLAVHIGMMLALSFSMTPTFTAALNAVPAPLYSHGSALLGTMQQVGGAAGAALLVTIMASREAALKAANDPQPLLGGVRMTFMVGSAMVSVAIVLSLLLRPGRPIADTQHLPGH